MATIIENEPCYIFHVRDYQESSLIVEALSPNYGAMNIIVRSARNSKSPLKGVFEPFVPLTLTVAQSRGDFYFLQNYERTNEGFNFPMPLYFCAMYVNELLHHLYHAREGDVKFFGTYIATLEAIAARKGIESHLRRFEFELLAQMGYSLSLWDDQGRMLNARDTYRFCFGAGFVRFNEYLFEKALNMGNGGRSYVPPSWGNEQSSYGDCDYDSSSDYDSDDGLMFSKSRVRGRRMESIPRNMGYGSVGHMGYEYRAQSRNTEQDELMQKYYNYASDFMGPVLSGEQIQDIISMANRLPDAAKHAKALTSAIINRLLNGREVVSRRMYREYNQIQAQKKAAAAAPATDAQPAAAEPALAAPAAAPVPPAAEPAVEAAEAQQAAAQPAADIPCDVPPPAWSLALNAPGASEVPPPAWSLALNPQSSQNENQSQPAKPQSQAAAPVPPGACINPVVQAAMNFAHGQTNPYFEQGGEGARMMEAIMPSGGTRYVSQFAARAAQTEDDYEDIPEFELRPDKDQNLSIGLGQEATAVAASQDSTLNLSAAQQLQSDTAAAPADSADDTNAPSGTESSADRDMSEQGALSNREQVRPAACTLEVDTQAASVDLSQSAAGELQVTALTPAAAAEYGEAADAASEQSDAQAAEAKEAEAAEPADAASRQPDTQAAETTKEETAESAAPSSEQPDTQDAESTEEDTADSAAASPEQSDTQAAETTEEEAAAAAGASPEQTDVQADEAPEADAAEPADAAPEHLEAQADKASETEAAETSAAASEQSDTQDAEASETEDAETSDAAPEESEAQADKASETEDAETADAAPEQSEAQADKASETEDAETADAAPEQSEAQADEASEAEAAEPADASSEQSDAHYAEAPDAAAAAAPDDGESKAEQSDKAEQADAEGREPAAGRSARKGRAAGGCRISAAKGSGRGKAGSGRKAGTALKKSVVADSSDGCLSGIDGLMVLLEDIGGDSPFDAASTGGGLGAGAQSSAMGDLFSATVFNDGLSSDGDLFMNMNSGDDAAARRASRSKSSASRSTASRSSAPARSRRSGSKS